MANSKIMKILTLDSETSVYIISLTWKFFNYVNDQISR